MGWCVKTWRLLTQSRTRTGMPLQDRQTDKQKESLWALCDCQFECRPGHDLVPECLPMSCLTSVANRCMERVDDVVGSRLLKPFKVTLLCEMHACAASVLCVNSHPLDEEEESAIEKKKSLRDEPLIVTCWETLFFSPMNSVGLNSKSRCQNSVLSGLEPDLFINLFIHWLEGCLDRGLQCKSHCRKAKRKKKNDLH